MEEMDREDQKIEEELLQEEQQETPKYIPRPAWQVWAARIGLVLFIAMVVMYYIHMFRGGK